MLRFIYKSLLLPAVFLLASASISLAQPVFTIQNKKDACNGLSNGSFDILATSGTGTIEAFVFSSGSPIGPISLTVNVPSNVSGLLGTIPGRDYLIVVSDNIGSSSANITIFRLSNVSGTIDSSTNSTSCFTPNGSISITASGGSGSYTYSWTSTNGFTSSSQDISGLAAGDYTVLISDNGTNCTQTLGPITITQPSPPSSAVLGLTGASSICVGQTSTVSVTITGGTPPYSININGLGVINNYTSGTTISVAPTSTTTYTLSSVTDAIGCIGVSLSGSPTITVNALPLAPAVTFNPSSYCVGATITPPTITSPTGSSTYTWYSDAGLTTVLTTGTSPTNIQLGFSSASVNTKTVYVKETNSSTCSGPATAVTLTVKALPVVSTPSTRVCVGGTMNASPSVGGTWVSNAPAIASITNAGLITGLTAGSVTFTFTSTATGCSATTSAITVNALPVVSIPSTTLCVGSTMTASPGVGGTWVSNAPAIASITNAGLITGLSAGTVSFTFIATATGCSATTSTVTVSARPVVSTPSSSLCIGGTMTASPGVGGTWVSNTPAVASITNAGLITGLTAGSVTFTFTATATGCSATTSTVTVNALPVVSTPSSSLCIGSTMTASPGVGGTWVSNAPAVASITNAGLITGLTAGSVTFTFTATATGCSATTSTVTVNALPVVSTPSTSLCVGATMTASPGVGGTWVSNSPAIASITNAGLITGLTAGSVTFTFTATATGCSATTSTVTVNALPVVSTPSTTLCIGSTMTASPGVGGTWVSNAPAVASITNAGLITGLTAGSVTFTFTSTSTGCSATTSTVTVNALPVVSTPSNSLCVGATMTASPAVGGTWVSNAPAVASITNAGLITSLTAGSVTFTFTATATGCSATTSTVTVNALPVVSTPSARLCIGGTMTANPGVGGTWVSNAPAVASITNAGLITGLTAGSVTFTFTSTATGCSATTSTITVNALPVVSTPSTALCVGSTMTASPGVGGTWVSNSPAIASITNGGLITGLSAGTVSFTFISASTGCSATTSAVTVNALPVVSTPSTSLCVGATMTASPGAGGTWVSNSPAIASITNAGLITGLTAGSVTFTFTATVTGCSATTSAVTVSALPVVSTPSTSLCVGATMTASPGVGGTWVSNSPAIASITNAGLITGLTAGSVTFTFTSAGSGCTANTSSISIIAQPIVSVPSPTLCIGGTMNASPNVGGTWVSSAPSIATIDNTGLVTALSAGTVTFTFTDTATGCSAITSTVTINSLPVISVSSATVCVGATITASPSSGGTWVSSAPAIATIDNSGLITGIASGTITFTFTDTVTGCSSTTSNVTVNNVPVISVSSTSLCVGGTISVSPGTGGSWISSDPSIATIDNSGLVTGVSAGTIKFTFIETATGCSSTTSSITVNPLPVVTTPSASLCIGSTMSANITSGGTWVTSAPAIATIDNSGLITGISAGSVTFMFTDAVTGCSNTTLPVTIENIPDQSLTLGTTINPVCSGGTTEITIANSESGVSYQLRNDADDSNIGSPVIGTGSTIQLSTNVLTATTTFNILAIRGVCSVELNNTVTVNVLGVIDGTIGVIAQDNAVCENGSTQIDINNSEVGVSYLLRNDADDSVIGAVATGTGATISLPTGTLNATTTFNILATNGACSIELTNQATVVVDINPDPLLAVAATISPLCGGGSTTVTVANSEVGVSYQLRDNSDNSLIGSSISGTGLTLALPTGILNSSITFNVLATGGVCVPVQLVSTASIIVAGSIDLTLPVNSISPICIGSSVDVQVSPSEVGVDYQLIDDSNNSFVGGVVAGTGGLINLPAGVLSTSTKFRVLVSNASCSAELTSTADVVVNTLPSASLTVTPQNLAVCSGSSSIIKIDNSEPGVTYQLRDDADDSIVSGAVIGNGGTINLPTGILSVAMTFNVLAVNGACSVELTDMPSIAINAAPSPVLSVVVVDNQVCSGSGTMIQVLNSEVGVVYQLRDNSDNSNVSGAVFGTGGTIEFPTGPITVNRTFNVLASNTLCSVQLSTFASVVLRPINDPLCSNCSLLVVNTINPVKVTCGVTVPDGGITFEIQPAVPIVNIIGIRIQIDGPTPKTQTNDFVFTGLAVGNYSYTVTYGDENNPDCIKTGSFVVELSREPDPITFNVSVDAYDCLVNKGSITLTNIAGAPDTDFEFIITSNNAIVSQGAISKSSLSSFKIEDFLLGDFEIVLSQNQQAVNGCVGTVNSSVINFSIAEPTGGCPVIIPNIFTPNGDGSNDFFEIRNLPVSSTLSITNRWGKEVYSSNDYQNNWSAENISDGIYYYRLVAEGEVMTGWVEILR